MGRQVIDGSEISRLERRNLLRVLLLATRGKHRLSVNVDTAPLRCYSGECEDWGGHLMLMEDFFNAVDRAFTRAANKISLPLYLELKTSLKLPLLAPESPQVARSPERRRTPERRLKQRRRERP